MCNSLSPKFFLFGVVVSVLFSLVFVGAAGADSCGVTNCGSTVDCNSNGIPDVCDLNPAGDMAVCYPYYPVDPAVIASGHCADAQSVRSGFMYRGTTVGMPSEGEPACVTSEGAPAVWYKFTAPSAVDQYGKHWYHFGLGGSYALNASSAFDSSISLWSACPGGNVGSELECNDDGCTCSQDRPQVHYFDSSTREYMHAGQTVYIRVSGVNGSAGAFILRVSDDPDMGCWAEPGGTGKDCNTNVVPDECDIASGHSKDINRNNIPDECEPPINDCNHNGVADDLDLSSGTSIDCNHNSVPDECDIAAGTSKDIDKNQVPDECQPSIPDCNQNSIADSLEPDSDHDGVIDACESCPNDPNKTQPGKCGCGAAETENCGQTVDCAGVPGGQAVPDRCGICGGDGQSYLGCTSKNLSALNRGLEESALKQRLYLESVAKPLARKCTAGYVSAGKAYYANIQQVVETYPLCVTNCTNSQFCANQSTAADVGAYGSDVEGIYLSTKRMLRSCTSNAGSTARIKKQIKKAKALYEQSLKLSVQVPLDYSLCCEQIGRGVGLMQLGREACGG